MQGYSVVVYCEFLPIWWLMPGRKREIRARKSIKREERSNEEFVMGGGGIQHAWT